MRVPGIFWGPGRVKAGAVTQEMASTLDVLPTFLKLAGVSAPSDRILDGFDLTPVLAGSGPSPRTTMFYYRGTRLFAARKGPFKAHFITQPGYGNEKAVEHDPPLLYHLGHDPSERFDVAKEHPDAIAAIRKEVAAHRQTMKPVENQLEKPAPEK
jgi:arylsulfatase A-like enzyme